MLARPGALSLSRRIRVVPDHDVDPHRALDVFEVLLTQISELDADLASDMIVNGGGNADAAGLCNALKPRRNINAVSKDIMGLGDYIADVDAHARKAMRLWSASPIVSSLMRVWNCIAARTASTALGNSTVTVVKV